MLQEVAARAHFGNDIERFAEVVDGDAAQDALHHVDDLIGSHHHFEIGRAHV